MPITAIARTQLAPVSPQWLLDTAHVSQVSPTLSLLRRLPVLKTICCRILAMQHFKGTHECVSLFSRKSGNVITVFRSTTLPKRFLSCSFYHLQRRKKHRMNLHYLKPPACKLSGPFCFPTWCGK